MRCKRMSVGMLVGSGDLTGNEWKMICTVFGILLVMTMTSIVHCSRTQNGLTLWINLPRNIDRYTSAVVVVDGGLFSPWMLSVQGERGNPCRWNGSRQDDTDDSVSCGADEHAWSLRSVLAAGSTVNFADVATRVSSVDATDQRHWIHRRHN